VCEVGAIWDKAKAKEKKRYRADGFLLYYYFMPLKREKKEKF
jgi:hypothetical protein